MEDIAVAALTWDLSACSDSAMETDSVPIGGATSDAIEESATEQCEQMAVADSESTTVALTQSTPTTLATTDSDRTEMEIMDTTLTAMASTDLASADLETTALMEKRMGAIRDCPEAHLTAIPLPANGTDEFQADSSGRQQAKSSHIRALFLTPCNCRRSVNLAFGVH